MEGRDDRRDPADDPRRRRDERYREPAPRDRDDRRRDDRYDDRRPPSRDYDRRDDYRRDYDRRDDRDDRRYRDEPPPRYRDDRRRDYDPPPRRERSRDRHRRRRDRDDYDDRGARPREKRRDYDADAPRERPPPPRRDDRAPPPKRRSRSPPRKRDAPAPKPRPPSKEEKGKPSPSKSRSLSWSPPPAVRRQMAEQKARKKREAAAAAQGVDTDVKTGKFWDGFRWVEHTPASQLPSNPATRKERRLYVGNLPQTFDAEQLRIFLNEALRACGAIPAGLDEVVVSSWVSPDHKFAFVELSTVEAATTALGLSGITCMGCQLKITHPNNYVVGALPGMGTALPAQYTDAGASGPAYAAGFGPNADPQQQEFMQAAMAAMAAGAPPG